MNNKLTLGTYIEQWLLAILAPDNLQYMDLERK